MATVVCQGLQSCLESQLVESRTLRLRLSSPKPHFSQSLELALMPCSLDSKSKELSERRNLADDKHTTTQNPDVGGWSFLQVLPNASKSSFDKENNVYVHPLIKRNASTLSEKSLELCTENLGSETGTVDIIDNNIFSSPLRLVSESETGNFPTSEQQQEEEKPRQLLGDKKGNNKNSVRSFPPPLTTMSGSESLHVRPHREDGRLVLQAVKAPSKRSYFQADRSEGRLRLSFVEDSASNFDSNEEYQARAAGKNDNENIDNDEMSSDEAETPEEDYEDEDEDEDGEKRTDVGAEMGMAEFQRPTRCKEGEIENKGLLNWEPFWVAT